MNLWVSTVDDEGDVLDDASYARLLKILLPYYSELEMTAPPKPNKTARNFEKQVQSISSLVRKTEEVFNTKFV